jgi:hypothetical protein
MTGRSGKDLKDLYGATVAVLEFKNNFVHNDCGIPLSSR